jgi:NADH-quinone oxidoreductase subunit J
MIFFILVGAVSIAAAVGVVSSRQPVHSALFLLTNFVTLAVMYVTLEAQFLAAVQVIIYAGGIVILILFVIMLIGSEDVDDPRIGSSWASITALALGALMLATLLYGFTFGYPFEAEAGALSGGDPYLVGLTLFTEYILPIEMVAILLLVALIGALLLARQQKRPGVTEAAVQSATVQSAASQLQNEATPSATAISGEETPAAAD